jgi:hypothetical protein
MGLPFGSPGTKSHSDATPAEWCRIYYTGEGGDFPRVWAVVNIVSLESPMATRSTKGALENELINQQVGWFDASSSK